jgi:hypothetical protein
MGLPQEWPGFILGAVFTPLHFTSHPSPGGLPLVRAQAQLSWSSVWTPSILKEVTCLLHVRQLTVIGRVLVHVKSIKSHFFAFILVYNHELMI